MSAYHKIKVARKTEFVLEWKKTLLEKEKSYAVFSTCPSMLQKGRFLRVTLEIGIVWYVQSLNELLRNRIDSTGSIGNMAVPLGMLLQYQSCW